MPDRVIRDELLESDRWLDLPSDTDRLAFVTILLLCDDFGNLEGGRRLFRHLRDTTQIKSPEATSTCLSHLCDADLLRGYMVDGRALFHLPRFRPHRQYLTRKCPPSPWDADRPLGKNQRVVSRGLAKIQRLGENVASTSLLRGSDVAEGVGVGVGELPSGAAPAEPSGPLLSPPNKNPVKTGLKVADEIAPSTKRATARKPKVATTPAPPPGKATGGGKAPASEPVSGPVWTAYAAAFKARYNVDPVRNATVNAHASNLVKRLGAEEAPLVAAFYVACQDPWALKQGHVLGALLNQCERYRTLWKQAEHAQVVHRAEAVERKKENWAPPPAGLMDRLTKVAKGLKVE